MTRAEQPTVVSPTSDTLAADSRERAVRALLRVPPLKRLWSAQLVGSTGDALALLVLVLMSLQAAVLEGSFGAGYRGAAFAVAAVFGARILATLLFGAVLLGPLTTLTAPGGPLDRRWLMIGTDGLRLALLVVAPLWIDWMPDRALMMILITVFVIGAAERLWTVAKDGAAPALLPAPPPEGAAVRPLPDHLDALRRLSVRTDFAAIPVAAVALLIATLVGNLLGSGLEWFSIHQAALGSYVAAGLFSASISILYFLELPGTQTPRPRSPLEGLRRPSAGGGPDKGRTGSVPLVVGASAAVAGAIAAAAAVSVLHAADLGGGPATFALLVLGLTGATGVGIRTAGKVLPTLSRRRLLSLATAVTGLALLAMGLVPDTATVLMIAVLAGYAAGVVANTGHVLVDQETEEFRRARTTEHLQAVVRVLIALGALAGPLLAAGIGAHRLGSGDFVFEHGGAAFALMLIGALLLPVAVIVLAKTDDRSGVPLRRDLREALRGGDPAVAPAATGFFIALEGGDGAGKSTQVEALADWIRAKGHEVVVTREPGATPVGKRLRSILLDVSSAGLSNRAEALLYAADRAEHVDSVVRPALERGAIVISDRYIDSSVAYQGAGRDLSPTEIARISRWATSGLVPHLTVLLDVDPETARERFTEAPDRLESEPPEFHARVRSGFLTLAAADSARYLVVDAGQDPESITTVVRHRLDQLLPLSEAEIKAQEEARKAAEEEARRKAEEEAARKAEEERLERERQEQLAKLRAEEEERKARELEEARRREAERQAEEARQRAEEARRVAEEERVRREAEEAAREAEQARLRRQAEEEARLRKEAEALRLEKQRKAEEALLRAEEARRRAEAEAAAAAEKARAEAAAEASVPENEITVPTPIVNPNDVTQQVPAPDGSSSSASPSSPSSSDEAETTMIPKIHDRPGGSGRSGGSGGSGAAGAADETTVLPPVRETDPADRIPRGMFRDERPAGSAPEGENERTRELPQVGGWEGRQHSEHQERSGRRPRPDWAEETPLDDLPTLADELLGDHRDQQDDGGQGRSGRGRRPRR
ncbi:MULTISPECIES: dTMP kinase [unclassified Streptomyces]|uniref:dTMP kinase n=1 Tax=unclassified Streptomyces TaxID=2593676 RepID=UPI00225201F8|nr:MULTISPECIES: dTMP kinase [unclassified Streptomyces]MCX4866250.1 dTMP kinase [Streptomyces sp. NBC_00906]MCX4897488.1 dTMP kinase [Streptomyces sp. NBC_00892]